MIYLTEDEIIEIHDFVLEESGGLPGIRDANGLSSLVKQPAQFVFGQELYPDIFHKAAQLAIFISQGHVFNDGNKRTSLAVIQIFLEKNGYSLMINKEAAEEFALGVANKAYNRTKAAVWIEGHATLT